MRNAPRGWMGWAVVLGLLAGCGGPRDAAPAPGALGVDARPIMRPGTPELVKDTVRETVSSSLQRFVEVNGTVFFSADDGHHGQELWKTDGTRTGTVLVKDVQPGAQDSFPGQITRVGERVFFVREEPPRSGDLWTSDGTEAGTVLVKGREQGVNGWFPLELTDVKGTLFFVAQQSFGRSQLWKSDGTEQGTVLVKDLLPEGFREPRELRSANGRLFFLADREDRVSGLWTSDGTAAGTVLLREFTPSSATDSAVGAPVALEHVLLLPAFGQGTGGLWRSDGTREGTRPLVPDSATEPWRGWTSARGLVGDTLFFLAWSDTSGHALWKTDGTDAGTVRVKALAPGRDGLSPLGMIAAQKGVFFFTRDVRGVSSLWKSDGTEAGTAVIRDLDFTLCCVTGVQLKTVGDVLYFVPGREENAFLPDELWKSDGTAAGTGRVQQFWSDYERPVLRLGASVGEHLLFAADDGFHGIELWTSEGTGPGTRLVADINTVTRNSRLFDFTSVNGTLYFASDATSNVQGPRLWRSDGTEAGTTRFDIPGSRPMGEGPRHLTDVEGTLYFSALNERGQRLLWTSDGTLAGTRPVSYRATVPEISTLASVNGTLFFMAGDERTGLELWRSDGTDTGTRLVKDIHPGPGDSLPTQLFAYQGQLYFSARDGSGTGGLWRSDGTEAGTVCIQRFQAGVGSLREFNGLLFFVGEEGSGSALWKSDGTAAGTSWIPGPGASRLSVRPEEFAQVGNTLFFSARDEGGTALWKTDGLSIELVKRGPPEEPNFVVSGLVNMNGTLFFTAYDVLHAHELWKSDGTEAGTVLVKDICPGIDGSLPGSFTVLGNWLVLSADDGVHGREVWVSDGTEAGTRMLADLYPGNSSSPTRFTRVGDSVFFRASDHPHGEELWRVSLTALTEPAPVPAPPPPSTDAVPVPVPDAKLEGLGCGVTSGLQGSLCSGLLLLGWLRARRPHRG